MDKTIIRVNGKLVPTPITTVRLFVVKGAKREEQLKQLEDLAMGIVTGNEGLDEMDLVQMMCDTYDTNTQKITPRAYIESRRRLSDRLVYDNRRVYLK